MSYEHEETSKARMGTGQEAPNPAQETVNFDTAIFTLRYGLTGRINLVAALPYYSIASDKIQGAPYLRTNQGIGDLLLEAEYAVMTAPHLGVTAGAKLATGNVDKTDEFGQRICDILALGSGTTDLVLGANLWVPHAAIQHLDLVTGLRHRFSSGANKWGYRFGDETDFWAHASYPVWTKVRLGLRFDGYHTQIDTWYGNTVPERGATMLYLGPTASWQAFPNLVVGGFARVPILMELEGAQMVADTILGLEFSANLTSTLDRITGGAE
jgi:hypothetical protein